MAAALVQQLAEMDGNGSATTSTVLSPASKTVTLGNTIVAGFVGYDGLGASPTCVDNLGNTYTAVEVSDGTYDAVIFVAPVTTGGSITSITCTHASTRFRAAEAAEFSGVDAASVVRGLGSSTDAGNTGPTGIGDRDIPANGLAVWVTGGNVSDTYSAGGSSGSPSTAPALMDARASGNMSIAMVYAIAGSTTVTGFRGRTTTAGAGTFTSAGLILNVPYASLTGRYLLESGAPDGYLLEDGSGVLVGEEFVGGATGTGAITLKAVAVSGVGAQAFSASGAITLQAVSVSGTGAAGAVGTGAVALSPIAISGVGGQTFSGSGAIALQPVSVSGTGVQAFSGTGAITLQPAAVSGTGATGASGAGAVTLQPVAVAGTGSHDDGPTGSGAITLQPISVSGTGLITITGAGAITLQPVAVSGTGVLGIIGSGDITLQPIAVQGSGSQAVSVTGSGSIVLAAVAVSGIGEVNNPETYPGDLEDEPAWAIERLDASRWTISKGTASKWTIELSSASTWTVELSDEQV